MKDREMNEKERKRTKEKNRLRKGGEKNKQKMKGMKVVEDKKERK